MMKYGYSIFILIGLLGAAGLPAYAYDLGTWAQGQVSYSASALLSNISPPGTSAGVVVASPSKINPNYYFHWVRDAALTMDVVDTLIDQTTDPNVKSALTQRMMDYIAFSRGNQRTKNRSGNPDDTGLGEPKFNVNGTTFDFNWGRPQNDGPALRASTLIRFALRLAQQGQFDLIRQELYDGQMPSNSVIKLDLEYVAHHWTDPSFDLWEEVQGQHFYTLMVQRRALWEGAALADKLGDPNAATYYRAQAQAIESTLVQHFDPRANLIRATLNRSPNPGPNKVSNQDVAVILAALHGRAINQTPGFDPGFFSSTDDRVIATALKLQNSFGGLYTINQTTVDGGGQPLGVAIGRYPEDTYNGLTGGSLGNPWFLATNAFAQYYYMAANDWTSQGQIKITPASASLFQSLGVFAGLGVQVGQTIPSSDARFAQIIGALRSYGDRFLARTKFHVDPSGAMSEEMNRDNGFMQGAIELTWSHASFLTAVWAR